VTAAKPARALPPVLVGPGNWLFRWRNLLFPVAFLTTLLLDRPRVLLGDARADLAMDTIGVLIVVLGQLIRAAAIGLVYVPRAGRGGRVHADELVEHGLFAHSRNPLYIGNFLVFLGLFTVLNSPAGWLLGVPAVTLTYLSIVAAEERFLTERFGARYEAYCGRVARFRPSLRGIGATFRAAPFDGWRVVSKEYGQMFTWSFALVLLLAWERVANGRGSEVRADAPGYAAAFLAIFGLYGLARFLKKTGRLPG
jgi:protein-S-isoprenylcysteine O-methyltransferase Ste14